VALLFLLLALAENGGLMRELVQRLPSRYLPDIYFVVLTLIIPLFLKDMNKQA